MANKYNTPKDYLDAAKNPAATPSELGVLAKADYAFVKLAVIAHPNVTPNILGACAPANLQSAAEKELAAALAKHPKTPREVLQKLTAQIIKHPFQDDLFEAALAICSHANTHYQNIHDIVWSPQAKKLRNELWKRCQREDVRALLKLIKDKNSAQAQINTPAPAAKPPPQPSPPAPQLDARLFGSWTWSSGSSSSFGYSMISSASVSVHETYVFMRDGRFIRSTDSFASQSSVTNAGALTSQMAFARTDVGDRGRWQVQGRNLHLNWDDNMTSDLDYFIASDTLELRLSSGPRYYLKN